jgi:hypothetical protein
MLRIKPKEDKSKRRTLCSPLSALKVAEITFKKATPNGINLDQTQKTHQIIHKSRPSSKNESSFFDIKVH